MDGIGGLIIGNLFKLNSGVIPRGYKGDKIGSKLAQTITGISHTVSNNDWVTKIEALNIILDENGKKINFCDLDLTSIIKTSINAALSATNNNGGGGGSNPPTFGQIPGGGSGVTTGLNLNNIVDIATSGIDFSTFTYPIGGSIGSGFEVRFKRNDHHRAVDIGGPAGDPIYSICEGTVEIAGKIGGYGPNAIYVLIDKAKYYPNMPAGTKWYAVYGHSNAKYVNVGDRVINGQHIADRGAYCYKNCGPHLHLQIQNTTAPSDNAGSLSVNFSSYFPAPGGQLTISSPNDVWK